jgi:hypothetical protein
LRVCVERFFVGCLDTGRFRAAVVSKYSIDTAHAASR